MPYRKGGLVKAHTRTIKTSTGTKRKTIQARYRPGTQVKKRKA